MNYYEILKVSKNASQQEIRDSYINLIKQYHPDIYKGSKEYGEKITKELNDAYDVLSIPEKRKEYDLSLDPPTTQYSPPDYNYTIYKSYTKAYNKYQKQPEPSQPQKETIDYFMKQHIHKFVNEKLETMSTEAKRKFVVLVIFVAIIFTILAIHDFIELRNLTELRKLRKEQRELETQYQEEYRRQLEELEQSYIYVENTKI